jgi:phage/plasmid-like protein (TIGR03299 family)
MAHLVETMMYVGETPWHGLGKTIPEEKKLSIDEAIVAAGLDWVVDRRPMFTEYNKGLKLKVEVSGCYAMCRNTDDSVLGVVGQDYTPLQNTEAFKWFQPFLDAKEATIETAGSLKTGRKVWVLVKIRKGELSVHNKDEVNHYMLLSNSHDGTTAVRVGFTPIRVVCNNTLCLAHESKASKLLRVKHTSRLHENLEAIREIMSLARREFRATVKQYEALASKGINKKDLETYVRKVFQLPDDKGGKELIPAVVFLFEEGRGAKEAGNTHWGAYNAVNGYLNYFRGKTQDNTLTSLWFGDSAQVNKRALDVALEMAV